MFVHETGRAGPRFVINFPTKRHWRDASRMDDVRAGLRDLVRVIGEHGIGSIAIPPLGCGLGRLDWAQVGPLIERELRNLADMRITLYAPIYGGRHGWMVQSGM